MNTLIGLTVAAIVGGIILYLIASIAAMFNNLVPFWPNLAFCVLLALAASITIELLSRRAARPEPEVPVKRVDGVLPWEK